MRPTVPSVLLLVSLLRCDRAPIQPDAPEPSDAATMDGITTPERTVLGANVAHGRIGADFLRVSYHSTDGTDSGVTPWQSADA